MGGMGEELVYECKLVQEATEEELAAAKAKQDATEEPAAAEEDAGDMDDPFAMMGGMGEETVYECNLVQEATEAEVAASQAAAAAAAAQEPAAAEEPAEEDDDGAEAYPNISYGAPVPEKLAE